jgi:membrane associated rhomboid family serine protease
MEIQYDSWYGIAVFTALELFTILRSGGTMFDHPAHFGGLVAGMIAGVSLRKHTPEATPPPPHEYVATVTELGSGPGAELKGDEG